jgi:hypothetical protein
MKLLDTYISFLVSLWHRANREHVFITEFYIFLLQPVFLETERKNYSCTDYSEMKSSPVKITT